jgi:nitrate reductase assembly molybdenum cofactor insertion protein NarJ
MSAALDLKTGELLAQAACWRLASLLLERPRPGWRNEIEKLSREVADRELAACARDVGDETEETYHRLFGPGGIVSPREVSYCGFEDPGRLMAELNAFYRAFLFEPRREEPIDHIAVETGFVGYLFLKESYAGLRRSGDAVEITRSARERFTNEHVLRCADGIIRALDVRFSARRVCLWLGKKPAGDG